MSFTFAHRLVFCSVTAWTVVALALTSHAAPAAISVADGVAPTADSGDAPAAIAAETNPTNADTAAVPNPEQDAVVVEGLAVGYSANDMLIEADALAAAEDSEPDLDETANVLNDALMRGEIISAHRPAQVATSHQSVLPPVIRVEAQRLRGIAMEAAENYEAVRAAFETCIGLGDETADNWLRLARARLHTGDFDGAEAGFLAAFQEHLAKNADDAETRAGTLRELGELYLLTRDYSGAELVLAHAHELAPGNSRIAELVERTQAEIDGEFDQSDRARRPLWAPSPAQRHRATIEHALIGSYEALPWPVRRQLRAVGAHAVIAQERDFGLIAVGILAALIPLLRRLRGHGDLVIAIEYPLELRGSFSVRISEQPGQSKRSKTVEVPGGPAREKGSRKTLHVNVGRETRFQRLIPKIYHVTIDGALMDPDNDEVLLRPFDEHSVEVRKGEAVRLEFDMQPRECPVDVHVLWDKQPTEDAGVAARGLPSSLRYTRGGSARLRLCQGNHTIVVGSGDRVAEREIEVATFSPTSVSIDLAGSEGVIFKGCPPAVKPYLHGDHNAAARALSRDGHNRIANVLLARLHVDLGQAARAADYYKAAGQPLEAAELRASLEDYSTAAELFAEAGRADRSAQMYREAGEWTQAGQAYEAIEDYRAAADSYRQGGDIGRWLGALEQNGDYFEAAQTALERSDRARAIRLLQLVPLDSPHYSDACELLADAFEHEGHADLAVQKIEQRMNADESSPDLQSRLASLLETSGEYNRALEVLEALRGQEPTYPNIASRIEGVRKKITAQNISQSTGGRSHGNTATPTAFLSEQRYEVLEELGRGGMGVVYKARDLRLNREVALKRLPENLREHPKAIQLFLREAQACARLNHRNIVTIFDTDQDDTNFFITMELLQGFPLNVIRRKRGRVAERDAARLGMQVSEGLAYAHRQGIVHRDIKTANLFFTHDKVVKIMDFGLAKMMEEVRRGTTVLGGTPYYMAPEQAMGGQVDQRADIYAFGVTLYELVTGGVPFSDGDVSYHHQHTPVTDPRERADDISDDIAELILSMMEKDPDRRCPNATVVGERLTAIANR